MSKSKGGSVRGEETGKKEDHPCDKGQYSAPKRYFASVAGIGAAIINFAATKRELENANKVWERKWRQREVWAIGAAAGIGATAIIFSGIDSHLNRQAMHDQQIVMQGQLNEMQTGDRAWIAPSNAALREPLSVSNELVLRVNFSNTGRQPALDFTESLRPTWVNTPKPSGADNIVRWGQLAIWNRPELRLEQLCHGVHVRRGAMVVFPSAASALDSPPLSDSNTVAAVKRGDVTFGVVGCIAYLAHGRERHSSFCFYLQPIPSLPPDQWDVRTCPAGNYAD
jgi:hypothetical protein